MKSNKNGFGLLGWLIVLAVLAAAGFFGFKYWQNSQAQTYEFDTEAAKRGELTQSVTATGTLNPEINVQVGSQVSGRIQALYADWNSKVTKGEVVAQIDPSTFEAQVKQAQGNLDNAKAALTLANIELQRTKELRATDSTPQSTLDQAQATVDQATAQVKTYQGSLDLSQANLANCKVISPVDGIVITRNVDVGQTVAAGLNAPIFFVIANDLANMQIDTNISEADIGNVSEGQDVDFFVDAFPYTTFHGKVVQVRNSPTTVQNVVTYDAVISVKNPDLKLKPGMTANLTVIINHKDDVIQVPNSAFRVHMPDELLPKDSTASPSPQGTGGGGSAGTGSGGGRSQGGAASGGGRGSGGGTRKKGDPAMRTSRTVYVLPPGATVPKPVKVKIGITDGAFTEITEGLNEGDRVVTSVVSKSSGPQQPSNPFGPQRRY